MSFTSLCANICTGWHSESLEREPLDSALSSAVYCLGLWVSGFSSLCLGFPGGKMGTIVPIHKAVGFSELKLQCWVLLLARGRAWQVFILFSWLFSTFSGVGRACLLHLPMEAHCGESPKGPLLYTRSQPQSDRFVGCHPVLLIRV